MWTIQYLINNENVTTYTQIYGNKMHTIDFLIVKVNTMDTDR